MLCQSMLIVMLGVIIGLGGCAETDSVREAPSPKAMPAKDLSAVPVAPHPLDIVPALVPYLYHVQLDTTGSRVAAALRDRTQESIAKLNSLMGFEALRLVDSADQAPAPWTITMHVDDIGPSGVAAGDGSWCDVVLAPGIANIYTISHEIGHCFDFDHSDDPTSWMWTAPGRDHSSIPEADIEMMVQRMYGER